MAIGVELKRLIQLARPKNIVADATGASSPRTRVASVRVTTAGFVTLVAIMTTSARLRRWRSWRTNDKSEGPEVGCSVLSGHVGLITYGVSLIEEIR